MNELDRAEEFHGHLGPWLVVGMRVGQAALERVDARKYFGVRVEVAVPPAPPVSCLVDGLQLGTGATTGKANLVVSVADSPRVRVTNTETGQSATITFPTGLAARLAAWLREEGDRAAARRVLEAPLEEICAIVTES